MINFSKNKFAIIKLKKTKKNLNDLKKEIILILENILKKKIDTNLNNLHKYVSIDNVNDIRIKVFEKINKTNIHNKIYNLIPNEIDYICSNDLAVQKRVNIGIHLPNDKKSIIDLHSDTLSGQSPFEIVQWIPLCDVAGSNSLFLFKNSKSNKINNSISKYEKDGYPKIIKENLRSKDYLKLKFGEILIFSPTNWHGNTENLTEKTRVSINVRFKPLFAPKFNFESPEKGLGTFYKIFKMSEASKIGIKYILPKYKDS